MQLNQGQKFLIILAVALMLLAVGFVFKVVVFG
jgi:hypothetical protein